MFSGLFEESAQGIRIDGLQYERDRGTWKLVEDAARLRAVDEQHMLPGGHRFADPFRHAHAWFPIPEIQVGGGAGIVQGNRQEFPLTDR